MAGSPPVRRRIPEDREPGGAENEWRPQYVCVPILQMRNMTLAILAMRRGDMSTLEQASTQIITLRPNSADGYALRAVLRSIVGILDAEKMYVRRLKSRPQLRRLCSNGNLNFAQKRFPEAETNYRQP